MTKYAAAFKMLLICMLSSVAVFGQGTDISITGSVQDTTQKVALPGVTVKALNESTGFATVVASDTRGRFTINNLPVGSYVLTLSFTGYQTKEIKGNTVNLGDKLVLPLISLEQGNTTLS